MKLVSLLTKKSFFIKDSSILFEVRIFLINFIVFYLKWKSFLGKSIIYYIFCCEFICFGWKFATNFLKVELISLFIKSAYVNFGWPFNKFTKKNLVRKNYVRYKFYIWFFKSRGRGRPNSPSLDTPYLRNDFTFRYFKHFSNYFFYFYCSNFYFLIKNYSTIRAFN